MTLRIAINGYGRIGRCLLRAILEYPRRSDIEIVLINEPEALVSMAYLTRFDSTHGPFIGDVSVVNECLGVNGIAIPVLHASHAEDVAWKAFNFDVLIECSGRYHRRADFDRLLDAGCPRVLLSNPGHSGTDVDRTVVYGINHCSIERQERIISAGSCTTNAAVPVITLLDGKFGVECVSITTLHSAMNDQPIIDGYHHSDLRRTRSAMQSMIPVDTELAKGIERLIPRLAGKVKAKAVRIPVPNVSAIDLTVALRSSACAAEINACLADAAKTKLSGVLGYTVEMNASIDFNHRSESAIVDGTQTRVSGSRLATVLIWFDNEWAYANRLLDISSAWSYQFKG